MWEWTGAGLDEGEDAAQWFSQLLGFPVRLVRYLGSGSAAAAQQVGTHVGACSTDPVADLLAAACSAAKQLPLASSALSSLPLNVR